MKRLWIVLLLPTLWLYGCGSDSGRSTATLNSDLKVLASNIIVSNANAAEGAPVATLAAAVDTQTQVLASNVIVDDSQLRITAGTVQAAFDEIVPDLSTFMEGTWTTLSYTSYPVIGAQIGYGRVPGSITFNMDGTFVVNSGISSETWPLCSSSDCTGTTGPWHIEEGALLALGVDPETFGADQYIYSYPINYSRQKMTLLQGERIVIMTKQP